MQTLPGIAVLPSIAIGEMPVVDFGGFRSPPRFLSPHAVANGLAPREGAIHELAANVQRRHGGISLQYGKKYRAISAAHPPMLPNQRHYLPAHELSHAVRQSSLTVGRTNGEVPQLYRTPATNDASEIDRLWRSDLKKVVPNINLC